ncbi:MAG: alpha/beta hydrolase [Pseudomonadota bacterium]
MGNKSGARLVLLLAVAGCQDAGERHSPAHAATERLPLSVCTLDDIDEPLLCGVLNVPENRSDDDGRRIAMTVVVIPAHDGNPHGHAWIEHVGGPRYSMVAGARHFADGGELQQFREQRDVVLVDPRGLHESGGLFCDALAVPRLLERYYPPDRVAACRDELAPRADLAQYSTLNIIEDYEALRRWLGYERWDAGGWSAGSRFLLTYLHRYPDSFRSLVLSIPSTLNFKRPKEYAYHGQRAFDGVAAACAADAACARRFPAVATDLERTLEALEREPRTVAFTDPQTGAGTERVLTRDLFAEAVWEALLRNGTARQLPYVLRHAAAGDFGPFIDIAIPAEPAPAEPEGHYFSVVCPEETVRLTRAEAAAAAADTFVGHYTAEDYIAACEAWGLPANPAHPIEPGVFAVPALIITGELDPVTPPAYGDEIAGHFTDVLHVTVPQMAHGVRGMANAECLLQLMSRFVERGTARDLDVSCVATLRPPPFRLD